MKSLIPPEAILAYKGVKFEVWKWTQEMFDGTKETFERLVRNDSVTVIPVVGEKIIIQHQEQPASEPFISLPGGETVKGNDMLDEAKREFLEETGYVSDDWELFLVFEPSAMIRWKNYYYIARDCKKIQDPSLDAGEKITLDFVSFDEFLLLADNPLFRHSDLEATLARARYDVAHREELFKKLFSS